MLCYGTATHARPTRQFSACVCWKASSPVPRSWSVRRLFARVARSFSRVSGWVLSLQVTGEDSAEWHFQVMISLSSFPRGHHLVAPNLGWGFISLHLGRSSGLGRGPRHLMSIVRAHPRCCALPTARRWDADADACCCETPWPFFFVFLGTPSHRSSGSGRDD